MNEENMVKKKKTGLVVGILLVVLLLIGGGVGYFLWSSKTVTPKKVFTNAINALFDASKQDIEKMESGKMGGMVTLSTNLKSTKEETNKVLEILNKLNIAVDVKIDANEEALDMNLSSSYNQKDLLDAQLKVIKDTTYLDLKSLYDKTIASPLEENEAFKELYSLFNKTNDFTILLENTQNAFNKTLKDEYFTQEKTTITLDNQEVKATKNTLILDEKNAKEMNEALKNEFSKEEMINALANITNRSVQEIQKELDSMIEEENTDTLYIHIYTYGIKNNFAKLEIADSKDSFILTKVNDTTYTYLFDVDNEEVKGTIELEKDTMKITLDLEIDDILGSISLTCKEYDTVAIDPVDNQNTILESQLSESDANKIMENLQNQDGIMELIEAFQKLGSIFL